MSTPFHLALVSARLERPGLGRAVDRAYRHDLDAARVVPRLGARAGARLLRLRPDRGLVLCRRKLRRLDRDLSQERHRRAAAGPVGGGGADDPGDIAHRHRPDLRHLSPIIPICWRGSWRRSTRCRRGRIGWNAVTGSSDYRGDEFRPARACPSTTCATTWPTNTWTVGTRAVGHRGSRARSSPTARAACWSIHTKVHAVNLQGQVLQHARPAQLRPGAARPAGHRAGRRLAARPRVRGAPCRYHRRPRQGHRRR